MVKGSAPTKTAIWSLTSFWGFAVIDEFPAGAQKVWLVPTFNYGHETVGSRAPAQ